MPICSNKVEEENTAINQVIKEIIPKEIPIHSQENLTILKKVIADTQPAKNANITFIP